MQFGLASPPPDVSKAMRSEGNRPSFAVASRSPISEPKLADDEFDRALDSNLATVAPFERPASEPANSRESHVREANGPGTSQERSNETSLEESGGPTAARGTARSLAQNGVASAPATSAAGAAGGRVETAEVSPPESPFPPGQDLARQSTPLAESLVESPVSPLMESLAAAEVAPGRSTAGAGLGGKSAEKLEARSRRDAGSDPTAEQSLELDDAERPAASRAEFGEARGDSSRGGSEPTPFTLAPRNSLDSPIDNPAARRQEAPPALTPAESSLGTVGFSPDASSLAAGPADATINARQPPSIPSQLKEHIVAAHQHHDADGTRLEVTLDPPELGRVVIELASVEEQLTARLTAAEPATLHAIRTGLPALLDALADAGLNFDNFQLGNFADQHAGSQQPHQDEPATQAATARSERPELGQVRAAPISGLDVIA
jgi:flagellar hook-length control protein FliK